MTKLPYVKVTKDEAQTTRALLKREGCFRQGYKTISEQNFVYFPITDEQYLKEKGMEIVFRDTAERPPPDQLEQVKEVLPEELRPLMTRAFDRIGTVLVLRLAKELEPYHSKLGRALLEVHPRVRTVALDRGVEGPFRVRRLEALAGEPKLVTEHREFGLRLQVDLSQCYFSPRLATERDRIVSLTQPGERVVDMFAGVGPFSVALARRAKVDRVIGCEWNPNACDWFRTNLGLNKVADKVEVREGDVAVTLKEREWANRVILNHPTGALDYLDLAFQVVRPGGTIHLYTIDVMTVNTIISEDLINTLKAHNKTDKFSVQELHGYSKGSSYCVVNISVSKAS